MCIHFVCHDNFCIVGLWLFSPFQTVTLKSLFPISRDGRLRESDQILVINDQILDAGVSHKDAIGMLHKIQGQVYLIIARGDFDLPPPSELQPMEQPQQEDEETDQAEVESEVSVWYTLRVSV